MLLWIKYDWTEGVEPETSRCYTEQHWCSKGIAFFPESSLKTPHFGLVITLFFLGLHYCLLFCYHLFWNDFSYCSLADFLQSQHCLYRFLSSISFSRYLCSPKPFCGLISNSSNKQLLNLESQEGARLGSKVKLQHSILSLRCQHWEVVPVVVVSWSSVFNECFLWSLSLFNLF